MKSSGTTKLVLFGAGGHTRVLLETARARQTAVSCVVDEAPKGDSFEGVPLLRSESFDLAQERPFLFLIGIGMNSVRARLFDRWCEFGQPVNLIHPFTCISPHASLGLGLAIMAGAVINAGSTIHDDAIINTSASIDHDCVIGAHAHICPGVTLAGNVSVGRGTMIGIGSSVIPGVRIGENCVIGAGSTVVRDIPNHSIAFGTPARLIRENEKFDFSSARLQAVP